MSAPLPRWIDPFELVGERARLAGRLPLAPMGRLAGLVHALAGEAEIELRFAVDAECRCAVTGRVEAAVEMVCQRCLEPFRVVLRAEVGLAAVRTEEAARALPAHYEPLLAPSGRVSLSELIEDELILALPVVARHEPGACVPPAGANAADETPEARPTSPFAVLARLKEQGKGKG